MKKTAALLLGIALIMIVITAVSTNRSRPTAQPIIPSGSLGIELPPPELDDLLAAEAVVVARYVGLTDLGAETHSGTPLPPSAPSKQSIGDVLAPPDVVHVVGTNFVIDEILKNDGTLTVNDEVQTKSWSGVLVSQDEPARDELAPTPLLWDSDTEFVVFLAKHEGSWYLQYGPYGRILTSGSQVTCSDPDRTILDFMAGMDRGELLAAIAAAVATPTP